MMAPSINSKDSWVVILVRLRGQLIIGGISWTHPQQEQSEQGTRESIILSYFCHSEKCNENRNNERSYQSNLIIKQLKRQCKKLIKDSPVTVIQATIGISISLLNIAGIIDYSDSLFHPEREMSLLYVPFSFLVLSPSFIGSLKRSLSLLYFQSNLEVKFTTLEHLDKSSDTSSESTSPQKAASSIALHFYQKLQSFYHPRRRYLNFILSSCAVITATDLLLHNFFVSSDHLIYPYSLYPYLEHTCRWIWTFKMADMRTGWSGQDAVFHSLGDIVGVCLESIGAPELDDDQRKKTLWTLRVISTYLPIMMFFSFEEWYESLVGLFVAVVVKTNQP